ncbi:hypothetical protein [Simiduia agarivorans]|uniref:Major facilitator superfamily transporter n=1 Tax=Simiduia agarivorans (strain DSM 21679 / JCM 13881 / BCRC 17597 / SA1) TaxID=1117647 RepID=K4KK28_SIMAS|nr:hypothetical protein [Simiduia agarivorans]AFU98383.1 major facilitator superfamily transporter [Simiduia agarivorans SA1 = DSM 21679]
MLNNVTALNAWLPRQAPNGWLARFSLAWLATAGLFYVNILPALVDGLITGRGFSTAEASAVTSSNIYGAALGALAAVVLVGRFPWARFCAALLVGLIALDAVSMVVAEPLALAAIRFAHGCVGGLLVGIAYGVFARTQNPARTFAVLLVVQYGLGGLGVMWLPLWVEAAGSHVLFLTLMAFSFVALALLQWLPDYAPKVRPAGASAEVAYWPLVFTLAALFLFQAGNNGPYAIIMGLAKSAGLSVEQAGQWLGIAAWMGMAGAALVIVTSQHFARATVLGISMLLTAWATWGLMFSDQPGVFGFANCLVGVTWALVIAYLLGMAAEFDHSGRFTALAGFASKMGLASGPLVAGFSVTGEGQLLADYQLALWIGAIALVLAWLLALWPARILDKSATRSPDHIPMPTNSDAVVAAAPK